MPHIALLTRFIGFGERVVSSSLVISREYRSIHLDYGHDVGGGVHDHYWLLPRRTDLLSDKRTDTARVLAGCVLFVFQCNQCK